MPYPGNFPFAVPSSVTLTSAAENELIDRAKKFDGERAISHPVFCLVSSLGGMSFPSGRDEGVRIPPHIVFGCYEEDQVPRDRVFRIGEAKFVFALIRDVRDASKSIAVDFDAGKFTVDYT
ncbi:MAG: hypothetical protein R3E44_04445 [Paracoccaceae bacterium]